MTTPQIKAAFIVDGKTFETKAAANEYVKAPLIKAQVLKLAGGDAKLADWLLDNQTQILDAYGSVQIKRVTKQERKALEKALDAVKSAGGDATKFIVDHSQAILDSFRWPTVQRLSAEEKETATYDAILAVADDNEAIAKWLIANEVAVKAAYVIKQEVNEEQLAKLRAGAEKAREARNAAKAEAEKAATAKK